MGEYANIATFTVMGKSITLHSEETCYGRNTVAEIDAHYHYLGHEPPTISSAIFCWQALNNRQLTNKELHDVMVANKLTSEDN